MSIAPVDVARTRPGSVGGEMTKIPAQRPPQRVDVVPHTHWDREWYG
jgi:hypothetical protein